MGAAVSARTKELFDDDSYHDYLLLHGLGVEMAEALAEYWHHRIRTDWGFGDQDGPTLHGLFRQKYRGGRYSWGYPACPDLEDNMTVANLLGADRLGIEVGPETIEARAEVITGEERDRLYAKQAGLYPQFAEYQQRTARIIPVIALSRVEPH